MKIYLVGGAVRDKHLGRPVTEKDWVVVGSTPEAMIAQGFKPVGKDFPVFLHPKTGEEYALARTEKKIAKGYQGFEFYTDPSVTLEEDLIRRDLTINAMAETESGKLVDPYHGLDDLKQKTLRHVSPAFVEDPVRILRCARFHARFPDFHIAPETLSLMQAMVNNGEVNALVAERVWQECYKALQEKSPSLFLQDLAACGALEKLLPELTTFNAFELLNKSFEPLIRFCFLCKDLNKTQQKSLCDRLKVPKQFSRLSLLFSQLPISETLTGDTLLNYLEKLDAFRRPEQLTLYCQFLKGIDAPNDFIAALPKALLAAQLDNIPELINGALHNEIPEIIRKKRLDKIKSVFH